MTKCTLDPFYEDPSGLIIYKASASCQEDAKKHLDEAIVTDEHFQEAAKKVRSSRESNPMERVAAPFYG